MNPSESSARRALQVMLLGALILVLAVFRPFGAALFLAAVLAMVLWPVHQWLTARFRGHAAPAAGGLVVLVIALVMGPLVGLSAFLIAETADGVQFVSKTLQSEGTAILQWRSTRDPSLPLYGRFVANRRYCQPEQVAETTFVPSRDAKSCLVRKCVNFDLPESRR